MQTDLGETSLNPGKEDKKSPNPSKENRKRPVDSAETETENGGDQSTGSPSKELVLYEFAMSNEDQDGLAKNSTPDGLAENSTPDGLAENSTPDGLAKNNTPDGLAENTPDGVAENNTSDGVAENNTPDGLAENNAPSPINFIGPRSGRVLPSIGAFTVQCAKCFKWRSIPTKEKYEEIRETILQEPFVCERAREWRLDVSCDDPTDISQDGGRLWAIDKPNIAQPPPGWERLLRIRGEGGTKFADVYYAAPSGKRLRSRVEVERFLNENPEYISQGVKLSQFSFQIPSPLQENYVRKRPARLSSSSDRGAVERSLEPEEVNPISWAAPSSPPDFDRSVHSHPDELSPPPSAAKETGPSSKEIYSTSY